MTTGTELLYKGRIQFWQNGIMIGLVSQIEAIEMVNSGKYRIINGQAIEWIGATADDTPNDME